MVPFVGILVSSALNARDDPREMPVVVVGAHGRLCDSNGSRTTGVERIAFPVHWRDKATVHASWHCTFVEEAIDEVGNSALAQPCKMALPCWHSTRSRVASTRREGPQRKLGAILLFCETMKNGRAAVEAKVLFEEGMARIVLLLFLELSSNACLKT